MNPIEAKFTPANWCGLRIQVGWLIDHPWSGRPATPSYLWGALTGKYMVDSSIKGQVSQWYNLARNHAAFIELLEALGFTVTSNGKGRSVVTRTQP